MSWDVKNPIKKNDWEKHTLENMNVDKGFNLQRWKWKALKTLNCMRGGQTHNPTGEETKLGRRWSTNINEEINLFKVEVNDMPF
jgi:hypothetical protein